MQASIKRRIMVPTKVYDGGSTEVKRGTTLERSSSTVEKKHSDAFFTPQMKAAEWMCYSVIHVFDSADQASTLHPLSVQNPKKLLHKTTPLL